MYFPLGWPKELLCGNNNRGNGRNASMTPEEMTCIVPNRYHMLFALLGKARVQRKYFFSNLKRQKDAPHLN